MSDAGGKFANGVYFAAVSVCRWRERLIVANRKYLPTFLERKKKLGLAEFCGWGKMIKVKNLVTVANRKYLPTFLEEKNKLGLVEFCGWGKMIKVKNLVTGSL
jgi:hypothetical protein